MSASRDRRTGAEPAVSVVVCAFTSARRGLLLDALDSLRKQSLSPHEVIVVVDHNPELLEWIRGRAPDVRPLENREGRGLAGARNSGVDAACGELVAFLDDDASAEPVWLERLVAAYRDPLVAGAGGAVLPDWERRPRWFPEEFNWVVGCSYRGLPQRPAPVRNLIGCNMSFRREVLQEVGGFSAELGRVGGDPLGCEETELCIRIGRKRPGHSLLYDPGARVRHRVPAERATWRYFLGRCYAEGISKARVARLAGRDRGLASERVYAARTLPAGARRELGAGRATRAGAIVAGLLATATGFLSGGLSRRGAPPVGAPRRASGTAALPGRAISAVVATRDRPDELAACLRSLLSQTHLPERIVVVDDAPLGDAAAGIVADLDSGGGLLAYVRSEGRGLAAAHNRGLQEVSTPLVAFTDDDVIADELWLERMVDAFYLADGVGCVTGKILPRELETQEQVWLDGFAGFDKGDERRVFDLQEGRRDNPLFPFAAGMLGSGANMAFSTAVLHDMGGFDPALGAGTGARGGDDLAAFFEVLLRGHRLVYEPAAIVHHTHLRESAALRRQVYGYGVGLTAYLTKCLIDRPALLAPAARQLPRAAAHVLSAESAKNARRPADYPSQLARLELLGMLAGPWAYAGSRRRARRADPSPAS